MKIKILTPIEPKIRGFDAHGSGAFNAPRGTRTHNGIDMCCSKGALIQSVCDGKVTKIGYPYTQDAASEVWPQAKIDKHNRKKALRYVQVTDFNDYNVRYFYISPRVEVGDRIKEGDILGEAQGLADIYPAITEHFHFEVKKEGKIVNPHEYLGE